jgi:YHYH protein
MVGIRRATRPLMLTLAMTAAAPSAVAQRLPLGDGHVTDHPAVGNVYSCRSTFRSGGARHAGAWFHGATWNPMEKPHVSGAVLWPDAAFSLAARGGELRVQGNGLPVDEPTGRFPIPPSDSAYRYDTNPNHIGAQHLNFQIPASPAVAAEPQCLPMGMIGFTISGVAFYNALDDGGRDAAAHEVQDDCDGHPQANSQYHYHNASPCIPRVNSDSLVGWALDGFPILGMKDARGAWITNEELDACHGRAEPVAVDGRAYAYAYRLTREYPYTLGCFTGQVAESTLRAVHAGLEPSRRGGRGGRGRGMGRGRGGDSHQMMRR